MDSRSINIVGCGRLAHSLGRLWAASGRFSIGGLFSRSTQSARSAQAFIGGGVVCDALEAMPAAGLWMLSTPDGEIQAAAAALAGSGRLQAGDCVFHCSGARSHHWLAVLEPTGAALASAHPVLSFASPEAACEAFAGSHVGLEGDADAVGRLREAFSAIGGRCFAIDPDHKLLYHAGSVFASNFTVTLLDVALQAYRAAGLDPDTARALMTPLVEGAIANALRLGPAAALSGPAARGDHATLHDQQACVAGWQRDAGQAYEVLTRLALDLARRRDVS